MGLLLEHRGEVPLPKAVDGRLAEQRLLPLIAQQLSERHRARNVELSDGKVAFTGGVFRFVTRWNLLIGIGKGQVLLDQARPSIVYWISFRQALMLHVLGAVAFAVFWVLIGALHNPGGRWAVAFFFCVVWPSVYLMNAGLRRMRFRRFLEKAVQQFCGQADRR